MKSNIYVDGEGLHGLSPTELNEDYLRVHRHLLATMRKELMAHLQGCRLCPHIAYWRDSKDGPFPTSDFYCDAHRVATAIEINRTAREIFRCLEGV